MAEREDLVERVKKLLEMSQHKGSNENEAIQAALMAQKLIADYSIEDYELAGSSEAPLSVKSTVGKSHAWRFTLAQIVAQNFRCSIYVSHSGGHVYHAYSGRTTTRTISKDVVFYGYKADAQAACMTYEYLYKMGNRLASREAKRVRKERGWADGVYNSFALGFCEGVKLELEKQCQALMLVVPEEVIEGREALTQGRVAKTGVRSSTYLAENVHNKGEEAGRDSVRSGRLGQSQDYFLP